MIHEYYILLFQINLLVVSPSNHIFLKTFNSEYDEISPSNHIFLKTFNSECDEIVVWFTDQNSNSLEIEDRINLTMVIK